MLKRSGVYKIKCNDCNRIYLGETGRKFECRLADHKRGEGNRTSNSLYARHFIEENHKFVDPLEEYEIIKIEYNTMERKLKEELEIIKERKKGTNNLMNAQVKFENEEVFYHLLKDINM